MKMYKTSLSKATCIERHGGYTEIQGESQRYVMVPELETATRPAMVHKIIIGIEYGENGEELGYTFDTAGSLISSAQVFNSDYITINGLGGWKDPDIGLIIEENILIISPFFMTHSGVVYPSTAELVVAAERLRVLFRQKAVIAIDGDGKCYTISNSSVT